MLSETPTIETFTSTQYAIIREISQAIVDLGGDPGLLCILGSWGDTLPESEILTMLREYNGLNEPPQRQHDQHTSAV
jgi:hypothetical protein